MESKVLSFIKDNNLVVNPNISTFTRLKSQLESLNVPYLIPDNVVVENPKRPIMLCVDINYLDREYDLKELYALVFFLKDFRIEYLLPLQYWRGTTVKFIGDYKVKYYEEFDEVVYKQDYHYSRHFFVTNNYTFEDVKLHRPLHIKDFLNLAPESYMSDFVKRYWSSIFYYFNDHLIPGNTSRYKEDWEQEEFETAFEGDASNYWNIE
ncbi:hypothetical protein [Pontibacter mangrovi]|nr:hypothetical protein [Pontibacter mangrovi]